MANTLKLGAGKWATGTDTVLAFNDENNNFKPLPFSFSRASSATVVNQSGLIETVGSGEPRIDFKDNTKGALKLEPQRTNLFTYSEDFSDASWLKNLATVAITSDIAPDGTTNSVYNYVGNNSNLYTTSQAFGVEYTISFYVKSNNQGADGFKFRLGNGYSASLSATTEWVRHTFTATPTTSVFSIASDGADDVNILVWGAQLEVGSYATSYIPTSGQSGGVTRVQETSANQSNNINNFGTSNFSLFIESYIKEGYNARVKKMQSWTTRGYGFYLNAYGLRGRVYGDSQIDTNYVGIGSVINNSKNKALMVVDRVLNTITIYSNGVNVHSESIAAIAGDSLDNTAPLEFQRAIDIEAGLINDFKIYNTALTKAEAIALTTI